MTCIQNETLGAGDRAGDRSGSDHNGVDRETSSIHPHPETANWNAANADCRWILQSKAFGHHSGTRSCYGIVDGGQCVPVRFNDPITFGRAGTAKELNCTGIDFSEDGNRSWTTAQFAELEIQLPFVQDSFPSSEKSIPVQFSSFAVPWRPNVIGSLIRIGTQPPPSPAPEPDRGSRKVSGGPVVRSLHRASVLVMFRFSSCLS